MMHAVDTVEGRARGAMLGLACGDAVGTTLEFKRPGSFPVIDDMGGGGPFELHAGEWTDDTSLALCLAESILDTGGMDLLDQHRRYRMWHDDGYLASNGRCFDIGTATRSQIARAERTGEPIDPAPDPEWASNGSIMRLAPVPVRWHHLPHEVGEHSAMSSRTTHPAQRPVDACRLLGELVAALVRGGNGRTGSDLPGVLHDLPIDAGGTVELHPQITSIRDGSYLHKEPPAIRGTGFVVDALEAALWAVAGSNGFRDAVLRAANLGDDADTTAAIAGQIAGPLFGVDDIPTAWLERLAHGERITSLADGLVRSATGTSPPWAFERSIHAWWVEPGAFLAGEYPGAPEPARARSKIDLLVDAGIRTFVDLTTPDDPLEPYGDIVAVVAADRNLELVHHHFPIPDLGVIDDAGYDAILRLIAHDVDRGRPVYVHCWGGVGRTGTVVATHLLRAGLDADGALRRIRELRAGTKKQDRPCPETQPQVDLILRRAGRS